MMDDGGLFCCLLIDRKVVRMSRGRLVAMWVLAVIVVGFPSWGQAQDFLKAERQVMDNDRDAQGPEQITVEPEAPVEQGPQFIEDYLTWERATGNWWGARNWLEDHGIFFNVFLLADVSSNFTGGLETGTVYRQLLDVNLTVETEPLIGWEGGTFYINFQNYAGQNGTDVLTGDLQGFDNLDADDYAAITELWYSQGFFEDLFVLTIGKVDANALFAYVEDGGYLLNSSAGFAPTIVGMPSYPDPAMSVNLFFNPLDWMYVGFGWYDGTSSTGTKGPATFFDNEEGYFLIGEVGVNWSLAELFGNEPQEDPAVKTYPGRFAIGGSGHTGTFETFDGDSQSGTAGFYLLAEQTFLQLDAENPDRRASVFFQYGYADPSISEIEHFLGGGVNFFGPIPGRENDVAGFYVGSALLSDEAGFDSPQETELELTYKVQVTPFFSIQPDLQYIFDPGGASSNANALVGTLRFELLF